MAITIDNKTYRNLEEQVLKNKEDIARHYEVDRVLANFGIKVLGVYDTVDQLPTEGNEFGDAYGVRSTSPMDYYVWTRANANVGEPNDYWLNVGALSIVGPQGAQGIQGQKGDTGVRGSKWYSGSGAPTTSTAYLPYDHYLDTSNGNVYIYSTVNSWLLQGNIRGVQGVQGPTGARGEQGIQGPIGPQGPKGDTGSSFSIGGLLESSDLLPTPTAANRSIGYAVRNQDGITYDLYVVVGTDNLQWVNMGKIEGVEGPQGPIGPQGPAGVGATIIGVQYTGATTGTLTQNQLNTILNATYPIINFNNEYYMVQDLYQNNSELVFSHVGNKDGFVYNKTFTLNTSLGSWVSKSVLVQEIFDITPYYNGDDTFTLPEPISLNVLKRLTISYNGELYFYTKDLGTEEEYDVYCRTIPDVSIGSYISSSVKELEFYPNGEVEFYKWEEEAYIKNAKSAQIIMDQGKLELATYDSNNNVVDINDSPNRYIQRKLNYSSSNYNYDEGFSLVNYLSQILASNPAPCFALLIMNDEEGHTGESSYFYGIIGEYLTNTSITFIPITNAFSYWSDKSYFWTAGEKISKIVFNNSTQKITIYNPNGQTTLSYNYVDALMLY